MLAAVRGVCHLTQVMVIPLPPAMLRPGPDISGDRAAAISCSAASAVSVIRMAYRCVVKSALLRGRIPSMTATFSELPPLLPLPSAQTGPIPPRWPEPPATVRPAYRPATGSGRLGVQHPRGHRGNDGHRGLGFLPPLLPPIGAASIAAVVVVSMLSASIAIAPGKSY